MPNNNAVTATNLFITSPSAAQIPQFYTSRGVWRRRNAPGGVKMMLKAGGYGHSPASSGRKSQMDVQQASYLPVEVHLASLDTRSKQGALAHLENLSRQSQTIRVGKASNTDTVTDFHFRHGTSLGNCQANQTKIIPEGGPPRKRIFRWNASTCRAFPIDFYRLAYYSAVPMKRGP